jgi:hypothetical protein
LESHNNKWRIRCQEKNAKIEQYEQSLKHLWQWLPLMYRHDYLKDYPAEKEILQGNRIRGNDE